VAASLVKMKRRRIAADSTAFRGGMDAGLSEGSAGRQAKFIWPVRAASGEAVQISGRSLGYSSGGH